MIPQAHIAAWRSVAPWPTDAQVEQDLILSRLIVDIANHALLGPELVFRGGTALHKLHLPEALRYSDDLDYVRRTQSGFGPCIDALREVATSIGLAERGRELSGQMVHVIFDADATLGSQRWS